VKLWSKEMTEEKKKLIDSQWKGTDLYKFFHNWAEYNKARRRLQESLKGTVLEKEIEKLDNIYIPIRNSIAGNIDKYPPPFFFAGFEKEMAEKLFKVLPTITDFDEYVSILREEDNELAIIFSYESVFADCLIKKYIIDL